MDLAKKQIPAVTYGEIVTKTDKQSDLVAAKSQKQVASIASSKAIVPHQNTQGQRYYYSFHQETEMYQEYYSD